MSTDVGFSRVCEWVLTGGDELLVNVGRLHDRNAAALWESGNWNDEKSLGGIGDMGRFLMTAAPKGGTELHVTTRQGLHTVMLVHTSAAGARDIGPSRSWRRRSWPAWTDPVRRAPTPAVSRPSSSRR